MDGLKLFEEDAIERVVRRLGFRSRTVGGWSVRGSVFVTIAWLPVFVLAFAAGAALGPEGFLRDAAAQARLLIAVPLLLLAEPSVAARFRDALRELIDGGVIPRARVGELRAVLDAAGERGGSPIGAVVILAIVLLFAWIETRIGAPFAPAWRSSVTSDGRTLTWAGLWYAWVSTPLFRGLALRWLWRLVNWALVLMSTRKLDLDLCALHPDRRGGLGELGRAHVVFAPLVLALSASLAGGLANEMLYHGASITQLRVVMAVVVVLIPVPFVLPLLVFAPDLARARSRDLHAYATLASQHARVFAQRWLRDDTPPDDVLVSTSDYSAHADLVSSYAVVKETNIVPVTRMTLTVLLVASALPMVAVVAIEVPVKEILSLVAGLL